MSVGGDGCVELPSSMSLYVWGVCVGGEGQPREPSDPMTNQVTILATYQCTNAPTKLSHSRRGVQACWMC